MLTLDHGSWRSEVTGVAIALAIAVIATSTQAQPARSRGPQIDGSTRSSFEASVASLQNELRPSRRAEFERALAVIWISNTFGTGDLDRDGAVDNDDFLILEADAHALLTDIQRGNLLSAIETRERADGYTSTDFVRELDGLGYDDILDLAGRPSEEPVLDHLRQLKGAQPSDIPINLCDLFPNAAERSSNNLVLTQRVAPRYPQSALDRKQSGAVCLEFTLDNDGTAKDIVVLGSTSRVFEQPALAALERWKYRPQPTLAGEALEVKRFSTEMVFHLGK